MIEPSNYERAGLPEASSKYIEDLEIEVARLSDLLGVFAGFKHSMGETLTKKKGSSWTGEIVGFYSTDFTPEGYAIESATETGSVQIYPIAALDVCEEVK